VCFAGVETGAPGTRYVVLTNGNGDILFIAQVDSSAELFREATVTVPLNPVTEQPWTPESLNALLSEGVLLMGALVPTGMEAGIAVAGVRMEVEY
jgi:hypothetical protein